MCSSENKNHLKIYEKKINYKVYLRFRHIKRSQRKQREKTKETTKYEEEGDNRATDWRAGGFINANQTDMTPYTLPSFWLIKSALTRREFTMDIFLPRNLLKNETTFQIFTKKCSNDKMK